jgi:hypothetical protein
MISRRLDSGRHYVVLLSNVMCAVQVHNIPDFVCIRRAKSSSSIRLYILFIGLKQRWQLFAILKAVIPQQFVLVMR